jgi:hypothetical protein
VCSDGTVWMTHKDVGKVTVIDANTFDVKGVFDTGRITNHVACVDHGQEKLAFVTVGGEDAVKVYTRALPPKLVATIPTGALPHGIWPSDDGSRVFVGLENADAVAAIDVAARRELARVPSGQAPQALVYVSNAVPQGATEAVKPLEEAMRPVTVSLVPPEGDKPGAPHGLAVVRALGVADGLDLNVLALQPGTVYAAYVADAPKPPWKGATHVLDVKTNPKGAGAATAVGPLRELVKPGGPAPGRRWLVVVPAAAPDAAPALAGELGAPPSGPAASR